MRAVLQRASHGRVTVDGQTIGAIERGLVVLLGVAEGDTDAEARWMAGKVAALRIFEDGEGKMNLSVADVCPSTVTRPCAALCRTALIRSPLVAGRCGPLRARDRSTRGRAPTPPGSPHRPTPLPVRGSAAGASSGLA